MSVTESAISCWLILGPLCMICDKTTVVKHQMSVLTIGYRTVSNYNTNPFTHKKTKNHNSKTFNL